MKEKIVLIGAGSAMFTRGLVADLVSQHAECDLALVDIDPEAAGTSSSRRWCWTGPSALSIWPAASRMTYSVRNGSICRSLRLPDRVCSLLRERRTP